MTTTVLLMAGTAILSSLITLLAVHLLYIRRLTPFLAKEVERASDQIKAKVKEGVREAGEELLPRLRQEVAEGCEEGVRAALNDLILDKAQGLARTTSTLVGSLMARLGALRPNQDHD